MSTQPSRVSTPLIPDIFIRRQELIERAAATEGLTVKKNREDGRESETEVIGTYKLDKELLEALRKVGFTFEPGRTPPHDTMIYLSGNSNQKGQEIFESDCWAWKRTEEDYQLTVYLKLSVSERERGVLAIPEVWGNCEGGACHRPTINKLVMAIASYFPDAHPLLKEVTTDSYPVVHWGDIGLGGIRSAGTLFEELFGHSEPVSRLASSNVSPFVLDPKQTGCDYFYNYFVAEPDQPRLFKHWRRQLQEYKNRLG